MTVLIAVASKHGSTREIAEAIAATLRAADIPVDLRDVTEVHDLTPYDAVILGSAIYAGSWLWEAKRFAEQNHAALGTLPLWVFSSGPLGADHPQPQDHPQHLAASLGDLPVRDHQIFVGKLDTSQLGFAERLITRMVHAPDGDFRDWATIERWARTIAATLTPIAPLW